ncbi:hypothetical protein LCGC14_1884580 [marine sediment metagenome]|uniref:Uncharacterized protein n=1 Tax=marine sediment metagenome TaxID=412755 RepID=A0A0F9IF83_9ZZZZ
MTQPSKEATILSRSEEILKILDDFQARLDNRFSRSIKDEGKAEKRPQSDNVLDEIMDNLEQADEHLSSIVSFISSDVLPKIN